MVSQKRLLMDIYKLTKHEDAGHLSPGLHHWCSHGWWWYIWLCKDWIYSEYRSRTHCWVTCMCRCVSTFHAIQTKPDTNASKYLIGGYRIQNRLAYGVEAALLASIILAGSSIPRVSIHMSANPEYPTL
jgi:hypothetical protein